ncbi:MAG: polysaccharide biosynthesis/export family protein [Phycisphaerales bacterium]
MPHHHNQPTSRGNHDRVHGTRTPAILKAIAGSLLAASAALTFVGCEVDNFMDPSIVGRWENTPTIVPILDRIDSIESDTGEFVEISQVRSEDLVPEALAYRIGAGDVISAQIYALDQEGVPSTVELLVDPTGAINIRQVGRIPVQGLTAAEAEAAIARALINAGLVGSDFGRAVNPVSVQIAVPRQQTFSIFGAVRVPSRFQIPYPDYRLLEALTDAGGISPTLKHVYVIRQVPLSDPVDSALGTPSTSTPRTPTTTPSQPSTPNQSEDILDLINRLTEPEENPGAVGSAPIGLSALAASPGGGGRFIDAATVAAISQSQPANTPNNTPANQPANPPAVDLIDTGLPQSPAIPSGPVRVDLPSETTAPITVTAANTPAEWRFVDGRWRKVVRTAAPTIPDPTTPGLPEGDDPLASAQIDDGLRTQRVIQVPVAPLLQGAAQYNIVIRPQDVVSVPPPPAGLVYMTGQIARPGVFTLDPLSELTLQRAMAAAGGLNAIGIPERVDLIRRVGENRQAVVRLNARAIWEGTQPDILLKPDDVLNFGTNFWATPLAVIRGGFRASYGFGFLLDRNFGNDVFGAPPTNVGGR